jgi:hypothetical protein
MSDLNERGTSTSQRLERVVCCPIKAVDASIGAVNVDRLVGQWSEGGVIDDGHSSQRQYLPSKRTNNFNENSLMLFLASRFWTKVGENLKCFKSNE